MYLRYVTLPLSLLTDLTWMRVYKLYNKHSTTRTSSNKVETLQNMLNSFIICIACTGWLGCIKSLTIVKLHYITFNDCYSFTKDWNYENVQNWKLNFVADFPCPGPCPAARHPDLLDGLPLHHPCCRHREVPRRHQVPFVTNCYQVLLLPGTFVAR